MQASEKKFSDARSTQERAKLLVSQAEKLARQAQEEASEEVRARLVALANEYLDESNKLFDDVKQMLKR